MSATPEPAADVDVDYLRSHFSDSQQEPHGCMNPDEAFALLDAFARLATVTEALRVARERVNGLERAALEDAERRAALARSAWEYRETAEAACEASERRGEALVLLLRRASMALQKANAGMQLCREIDAALARAGDGAGT